MYKLFLLIFFVINFSLFPSENNEVREVLPIESIHNDNLKNEDNILIEKTTMSDEEKDLFEKGRKEYTLEELRATNIINTNRDLKENKKDEYSNDVKFEEISERTNRVMALGSAMGAVDLGKIEERKFRIGAGVGNSGNNQAVAVGVGYAPTDRFRVNTKFSTSSTSKSASAISIGASIDLDW
ncbi:hypothetical protein HMPREF9093_01964 [Fusobacterium sp. oral taxon 370 str. F0437]|uniref:YadA C-terminal domain-containing protein n=1 Tax=Fusobacterium sp. oral taxon 370 TaxID=712288 RepID=UPI000234B07B|nr:YadA C-terminal domain-containing protein [Fusobacterium sp. oral taxon 370]EHI76918.1 hypothetical protein HMPREF9093_01964 [Fusobacterium sp. oral taxon 370 str. F0437]